MSRAVRKMKYATLQACCQTTGLSSAKATTCNRQAELSDHYAVALHCFSRGTGMRALEKNDLKALEAAIKAERDIIDKQSALLRELGVGQPLQIRLATLPVPRRRTWTSGLSMSKATPPDDSSSTPSKKPSRSGSHNGIQPASPALTLPIRHWHGSMDASADGREEWQSGRRTWVQLGAVSVPTLWRAAVP